MPRRALSALLAILGLPLAICPQSASPGAAGPAVEQSLRYSVEWRLVRAGTATLTRSKTAAGLQSELHLESTGLVNTLYRVDDRYRVAYDPGFCASSIFLKAEEGKRRRETQVRFDAATRKSHYLERDTLRNAVVLQKDLDVAACVQDILAGIEKLRGLQLPSGQATQFPISDGKRFVNARIEVQDKEQVQTPLGTFQTIRYEAFLFNDALFARKGRLFVWVTDDNRRLPVQIRAKLNFPVGTISVLLEKIGPS